MRGKLETVLEGTQVTDLDDTYLHDVCGLTSIEIATLRSLPKQDVSTLIPLVIAIGKERAKNVPLPFIPEVNTKGYRRCVHVDKARCERYGTKDIPVCRKHREKAKMLGNHFGSPMLRETFRQFHEDPHKLQCTSELSLMRTMLAALLHRITDDNLNIEVIAGVTTMCEKITQVIERIGKIEKVTPEHLSLLMKQMTEVAAKYIPAEKLEEFANDVENISLEPKQLSQLIPYLPGNEVDVNGEKTVISIQKKALIETAARMGVVVDE